MHRASVIGRFRRGHREHCRSAGQTLDDIVADLLLAQQYPVSMMSCSAFIPSEDSPYRAEPAGSLDLTLATMALMRIMNPRVLMPTTSSLEKPGRTDSIGD